MAAHGGGACPHGEIEHAARAARDVLHREGALGLAGDPDRLLQRAGGGGDAVGEQHLVEMDVRLDEARRHQPGAELDRLAGRPRHRIDAHDTVAGDGDVHQVVAVGEAGAAQQQIDGIAHGAAPRLP